MRSRRVPNIGLTVVALLLAGSLMGGCAAPIKEVVATKEAPFAIGPYSQGVKVGNLLFLSGQAAISPATNQLITGSVEEQTRQVMENLSAVLKAAGMSMENVVSTTVYMKDVNDFGKMNAVYGSYFKTSPPARATVEGARLPRDALVSISAIAVK
jgi:2-iminobutanoate/2-iminopropanoate deaminase